jgi:hypothetical protein
VAGFPTKRTWLSAIQHNYYSTWQLINVKNVSKHFPQSEETQQEHMKSQRQGILSTKQHVHPDIPTPALQNTMTSTSKPMTQKNTIYTDQTSKLPHVSSRGFQYQMILYHVDSNSIWVEPTKTKQKVNSS